MSFTQVDTFDIVKPQSHLHPGVTSSLSCHINYPHHNSHMDCRCHDNFDKQWHIKNR